MLSRSRVRGTIVERFYHNGFPAGGLLFPGLEFFRWTFFFPKKIFPFLHSINPQDRISLKVAF